MNKKDKLNQDIMNAIEKTFADAISKKEEDENSRAYKEGLITPEEYLRTKEFYKRLEQTIKSK